MISSHLSSILLLVNECNNIYLKSVAVGLNEITQNKDVYLALESAMGAGLSRTVQQGRLAPTLLSIRAGSSKLGAGIFQSLTHRSVEP